MLEIITNFASICSKRLHISTSRYSEHREIVGSFTRYIRCNFKTNGIWHRRYYIGTCESAVCVRIESRIESGVKIRIRIESTNRIFSTTTNIN